MIFIITGYKYVVALTSYNAVKILLLLKYIVSIEFIKICCYRIYQTIFVSFCLATKSTSSKKKKDFRKCKAMI